MNHIFCISDGILVLFRRRDERWSDRVTEFTIAEKT